MKVHRPGPPACESTQPRRYGGDSCTWRSPPVSPECNSGEPRRIRQCLPPKICTDWLRIPGTDAVGEVRHARAEAVDERSHGGSRRNVPARGSLPVPPVRRSSPVCAVVSGVTDGEEGRRIDPPAFGIPVRVLRTRVRTGRGSGSHAERAVLSHETFQPWLAVSRNLALAICGSRCRGAPLSAA